MNTISNLLKLCNDNKQSLRPNVRLSGYIFTWNLFALMDNYMLLYLEEKHQTQLKCWLDVLFLINHIIIVQQIFFIMNY